MFIVPGAHANYLSSGAHANYLSLWGVRSRAGDGSSSTTRSLASQMLQMISEIPTYSCNSCDCCFVS